jgi:signal transduction histidine kinase
MPAPPTDPAIRAAAARGNSGLYLALLLYTLGVAGVVFSEWAARASLGQMYTETEARKRARETLLQGELAFSEVRGMEASVRSFAVTGEERFLEPYHEEQRGLHDALRSARALLATPHEAGLSLEPLPTILTQLGAFERATQSKLALLDEGIARVRQGKRLDTRAESTLDEGRRRMDRVRSEMGALRTSLRAEIALRNGHVQGLERRSARLIMVSNLVSALLLVLAAVFFIWLLAQRARAGQQIAALNAVLERRVVGRTAALVKARDDLRRFAGSLTLGAEAERRRLAREVHDQMGQILTTLKLGAADDPERAVLIDEAIRISRRISHDLRPAALDDLGLAAALSQLGRDTQQHAGIEVRVMAEDNAALDPHQATQLYRITQEAVTNALRHARARRITIRAGAEGGRYGLDIEDDGIGCDGQGAQGSGLLNMRERARLAGGEAGIARRPEGGTVVSVHIPLPAADPEAG